MDPQLKLIVPIPIIEEIISLSALAEKVTFRITCKRFLQFTTKHFFPILCTTLCGTTYGYQDGESIRVLFKAPHFGVLNAFSTLFISDYYNHVIRKIDLNTHQITTLCGTPMKKGYKDGKGSHAQFECPSGLALDEKQNLLYISDLWNHRIRSVNLTTNIVNTVIPKNNGGLDRSEVPLKCPCGLAFDPISNYLYVADKNNHSIRKISLNEKKIETLCGGLRKGYRDGLFEETLFHYPNDIALNLQAQELYVSDSWNHAIRVLSLRNRRVSTLCEPLEVNGDATQPKFNFPRGLGLDTHSHYLYVSDEDHVIRRISLLGKMEIDIVCGTPREAGDKNGLFPTFHDPRGIVVDARRHSLYIMDCGNHKIRKITDRMKTLSNF